MQEDFISSSAFPYLISIKKHSPLLRPNKMTIIYLYCRIGMTYSYLFTNSENFSIRIP